MVKRVYDLTLRQAQALTCIAYRKNIFEIVKVSDLITDMGVALNDGLAIYNNAIAALAEKDKQWATDIDNDAKNLTTALLEQQKIF